MAYEEDVSDVPAGSKLRPGRSATFVRITEQIITRSLFMSDLHAFLV